MDLLKYNPHWKKGFEYKFPVKRDLFEGLKKSIEKKFIITITGIRRTGKTTLVKQLISEIEDRKRALYFSFDEEQPSLDELIKEYSLMLRYSVLESDERHYIFLDEVQKLENWQNQVKTYYDIYPNLKFVISGSCSLFIRKKSRETLAGRTLEFTLEILSFMEFLRFSGKEELVRNKKMFGKELEREFETYLFQPFIDLIGEDLELGKKYLEQIARKTVFEDKPMVFPIDEPSIAFRILKIIAGTPGMHIKYESLANDLGISSKTASRYVEYLEESFLIRKLYNFSKSMSTSEKKLKRAYPSVPMLSLTFADGIEKPRIVENTAVCQLDAKFFWRSVRDEEVDIVLDGVPVEVKYANRIDERKLKGIHRFMERYKAVKGYVLTKKEEKKGKIEFIPIWKFLLEN